MKLNQKNTNWELEFKPEELDNFTFDDLRQVIIPGITGVQEQYIPSCLVLDLFPEIPGDALLIDQLPLLHLLPSRPGAPFPAHVKLASPILLSGMPEPGQITIRLDSSILLNALSEGTKNSPRLASLCEKFLSLPAQDNDISKTVETEIDQKNHAVKIKPGFIHHRKGYGHEPKVLGKLAYIFHKLGLGVIQEIRHSGELDPKPVLYDGNPRRASHTKILSLGLSPFGLFQLFPAMSFGSGYTPKGNGDSKTRSAQNPLCQLFGTQLGCATIPFYDCARKKGPGSKRGHYQTALLCSYLTRSQSYPAT